MQMTHAASPRGRSDLERGSGRESFSRDSFLLEDRRSRRLKRPSRSGETFDLLRLEDVEGSLLGEGGAYWGSIGWW